MPTKKMKTLDVRTRSDWRRWLEEHHDSASDIWLVFHKVHTSVRSIPYEDAVEEALCFGWIDSLVKRIDDDRYARKFTPRKRESRWSDINRRRYQKVKAKGLLRARGLERAPTSESYPVAPSKVASDIRKQLMADPRAWAYFERLTPSHRRNYLLWIESAKRPTTRQKRIQALADAMAQNRHLE